MVGGEYEGGKLAEKVVERCREESRMVEREGRDHKIEREGRDHKSHEGKGPQES